MKAKPGSVPIGYKKVTVILPVETWYKVLEVAVANRQRGGGCQIRCIVEEWLKQREAKNE